jgi:hypothetical protein
LKQFNVIVDTGSSSFAVASSDCSSCQLGVRSSYTVHNPVSTQESVQYGLGSWSGGVTSDQVTNLTSSSAGVPLQFAAIDKNQGFFTAKCPNSDGIWGMAYESLSQGKVVRARMVSAKMLIVDVCDIVSPPLTPLLDVLVTQQSVPNGFTFQLCQISPQASNEPGIPSLGGIEVGSSSDTIGHSKLAKRQSGSSSSSSSSNAGNLWIGGYDSRFIAQGSQMTFVPLVAQNYYGIDLQGISVGGKSVSGLSGFTEGSIIDSGTTGLVLKQSVS